MKKVIEPVQNVFSDEEIRKLIEQYIRCNGDFSEFYNDGNEVTELSLDMIPKAITKYILDNVIEFIEYCDNRQVRLINEISKLSGKEVEFARMIHIVVVRELMNPLREFMEENFQRALPEMIANYRTVCQVHGILEQNIEEVQENNEENEKTLEELEQELKKLQIQNKRTTQQRDESKLLRNAYKAELEKENVY